MESQWVTLYDEKAEKFFGITADKMDELLNNDPFAAEKVLDKVTFSRFKFRCEIFDVSFPLLFLLCLIFS